MSQQRYIGDVTISRFTMNRFRNVLVTCADSSTFFFLETKVSWEDEGVNSYRVKYRGGRVRDRVTTDARRSFSIDPSVTRSNVLMRYIKVVTDRRNSVRAQSAEINIVHDRDRNGRDGERDRPLVRANSADSPTEAQGEEKKLY